MAEFPKFLSAQPPRMYIVIHDVTENDQDNFAGRTVLRGEVFYRFTGNTVGCDPLPGRVYLSAAGPTAFPFFEFPLSELRSYIPSMLPGTEALSRIQE